MDILLLEEQVEEEGNGDIMAIRTNTYKGFTEDQLKSLSIEEFMDIVTSRERRALKRLSQNPKYKNLIQRVRKKLEKGDIKKPIKTHVREAVILPEWIGLSFLVYNGKEWKKVSIDVHKVGRRLGEFSHSTSIVKHSGPGVGATRGSKFVPLK